MGNKFRRQPRFQLFNVPNDLKHQAQRAGEEWADNMGYCSQCRELRRPMVVTAGKDPKDGRRFIYMLCAGCVKNLDQMKAGIKPEEFLKDALGNLLKSKETMDKAAMPEFPKLTEQEKREVEQEMENKLREAVEENAEEQQP